MFCESIIESRIINLEEVINVNKLLKLFKNNVEGNEEKIGNIKLDNRQIKRWPLLDYLQLIFGKPFLCNKSELVLSHWTD